MSRTALLVVCAVGCGRVGFDARTDASTSVDVAPDVSLALPEGTCADPIDLAQFGTASGASLLFQGTTVGASDHGEPSAACSCAPGSGDVVFRYTPPASGRLEVMSQGNVNDWDPTVHARSSCSNAGSQIACSHDIGLFDDPTFPRGYSGAWFEIDVTAGVPIFLFADGCRSSGTFDLQVRLVPSPFTGSCANPIELAVAGTVQGDGSITYNGDTSLGFDHADSTCDCESPSADVVMRWVPATSGQAAIQMNGGYDVLVHARSTCASVATELGCNDDNPVPDSEAIISVTAGQPVFIFADGCRILERGPFQFRVVPP